MFDDALPEGTVVGEFEIRRVLGYGGFGIVYEAYEAMLDRRVALKEYFLRGFSRRKGLDVYPINDEAAEMFNSGATRFVREARLLSMLNERTRSDGSLVAVYRVFQAHGTAFMAMKLYEGGTLKQWVKEDPSRVTEAWLIRLLGRLLDALDALHSLPGENLVHRDVSPDNIILQPDGTPVLLDFGATRKANDAQTSLIFKPGYSPIEQYTDSVPQGPWTDLYALCGVAYFCVSGQSPMPAVDRHAGATFHTAAELGAGRFSPAFLALIDHGMAVLPDRRFRSCAELRDALARLGQPATATAYADDDETTRVIGSGDTPTVAWPGPAAPSVSRPSAGGVPSAPAPLTGPHAGPASTWPAGAAATRPGTTAPSASAPAGSGNRKTAALLAGGGTLVALLVVLGWQWTQRGGATPDAGAAVAVGPAASAAVLPVAASQPVALPDPPASAVVLGPALVPGLKCTAEQADWPCVLEGLARLSSAAADVQLKVTPARLKVGRSFTLDVTPSADGRLQILGVNDRSDGRLTLVFPNAHDADDRLHAGRAMRLPRRQYWNLVAQPPTGRSYMVAVVTPVALKAPRPLRDGLSLKEAVAAFESGRPMSLLGVADCTPGGAECPKSLAIRSADFIID